MGRTFTRYALVFALISVARFTPAHATFHLMVVQEVFPGTPSDPGAQYVMLRMTSSGQNFTLNTFVEVQDAQGVVLGRFGTFDHNVANGGSICSYPNCPAILIGTGAAQSALGFSFDQIVDAQANHVMLPPAGGRLCFRSSTQNVDCVAWGGYTGINTIPTPTINGCDANFGAPAAALSAGFALTRKQFSCASKENSLDFENRFPHPVANNGGNANTDPDADGLINALDCADSDSTALYFPLEVKGDTIGLPTTLIWDPQGATSGSSTAYDIASGSLSGLHTTRDYTGASCLAMGLMMASFADPTADPPVGEGAWYLIRADNACGHGTWGESGLIPDPRDLLDAPGTFPCP